MNSLRRNFKKQQHIIVPALAMGIAVLAFFLGVVPLIGKTGALQNRSRELTGEITVLKEKRMALDALDEETLRTQLFSLLSAVPSDKSLPLLFSTLDSLSAETGITVSDMAIVSPGAIASASGQQKQSLLERDIGSNLLTFSITIDGNLDQIRSFLEKAIAVRRFFRVRQFSLGFTSGTVGKVRVSMDAFYAPLPTSIGKTSQPLTPLTEVEQNLLERVGALPLLGAEFSAEELPPPDAGGGKTNPFE